MLFWVGLAVVLVIVVGLVTWGVSGIGGRSHEPGTQHLDRPRKGRSKRPR